MTPNAATTVFMMPSPLSAQNCCNALSVSLTMTLMPCITVWMVACTSIIAMSTTACTCGNLVLISCQNFWAAITAANSPATKSDVTSTILAIGAAIATNAATSATPITAASAMTIGTRLSLTSWMNGCSWREISAPWPANCSKPGMSSTTLSMSVASGSSALMTALTTPRIRSLTGSSASENLSKIIAGTSPSDWIVARSVSATSPSVLRLSPAMVMAVMASGPRSSHCVPNSLTPAALRSTSLSMPANAGMMILNASAVSIAPLCRPSYRLTLTSSVRSVKYSASSRSLTNRSAIWPGSPPITGLSTTSPSPVVSSLSLIPNSLKASAALSVPSTPPAIPLSSIEKNSVAVAPLSANRLLYSPMESSKSPLASRPRAKPDAITSVASALVRPNSSMSVRVAATTDVTSVPYRRASSCASSRTAVRSTSFRPCSTVRAVLA